MGSTDKFKLMAGCGIILVGSLLSTGCHGASTVPSSDPAHHRRGGSSDLVRFDTKAKLVGFNRAVGERLQRAETDLRPLQRRAARLERLVSNFQQHKRRVPLHGLQRKDASRDETLKRERNGLLREANRLRTDVDRKVLRFRELDRNYRNVRQLLPTPGGKGAVAAASSSALPRAWLDRDTERQMEQNERVYKNIINLLVQLIEVPVNIIHDMIGDGEAAGEAADPASTQATSTDYGAGTVTEQATPNEYGFEYDEESQPFPEPAINAVDGEAEGPAAIVHDAEWLQFHY
uniref:Uncharacterized protein n=1 Tax=Anopheles albimanus TaxID=7167 RepID=A0A182F7A8_ANOAL